MAELKWIKVHLFLILGLQFTVCTITGSSVFIRSGDDLVLSCQHVISGQINCNGTTWVYSNTSSSVELVKLGKVENVQSKSNRLSLAANCSLVMRNITVKDAGYYTCQQYKSGAEPSEHIEVNKSGVSLSVVHMSEQKDTDVVTLTCSVASLGHCGYTVKWLTDCSTGKPDLINCPTQHSGCSAAVCFKEHSYTQSCEFKCEITNHETTKIFNFNHQCTEDKSGKTSCSPATKPGDTTTSVPTTKSAKVPPSKEGAPYITAAAAAAAAAAVVLVALLTVAGIVIRWRTKRNMKQVHVYAEVNPTVPVSTTALETSRDNVEPEDGVYYSTISETPVRFHVVVERDDMTYSTVAAPGPPAAAITDPNGLYSLLTAPGK
ncbi:uncharacterized protein LOC122825498 isoform X2 [Gambusia affinis]|nr:uncharacterized protein LOC122825498 isoform X2 [Gambusia affinis]XP_043962868.1 uncharacterized protein LOC122825498 isoform X2 [Gambusia affinis]